MHKRFHLGLAASLILFLTIGCAGRRVAQAPIPTVPEDADVEVKIELLEEMAFAYPEDPNLFFEIGNLYYDQLMPDQARTNYERALALDPDLNKARVNLAMVLVETDEADSARAMLLEAIRIDPTDAKAHNNLGMVYYTELDVNNAVKYFMKALEIEPGNAEARYNLGLAFAEAGLLLEAVREWRTIIETDEESETAQRARLSLERAERELKE
jgi:tetratricopeptide (TPR) repeat protein